MRAAERELAASSADIGVAVADLYPRIFTDRRAGAGQHRPRQPDYMGQQELFDRSGARLADLQRHRTRANIEVANARQEQALIAYRKTVLGALQDVEDSLSRSEGDREQLVALQAAFGTAARAEDIARTRYRGGLVTYSDVLLAEARRLKLEEQMIETRGALARDTAALFKALGGGWPELAEQGGAQ